MQQAAEQSRGCLRSLTKNLERGTWNLERGTWNLELGTNVLRKFFEFLSVARVAQPTCPTKIWRTSCVEGSAMILKGKELYAVDLEGQLDLKAQLCADLITISHQVSSNLLLTIRRIFTSS
jgi:hypothetical protein